MSMKKFTPVAVMAVLLCVCGIELAAAVKVDLLPLPGSVAPEPDASGHAVLNYAKGADKTEVQVNCWDLTSETEYTVYLCAPGPEWYEIGSFTTRKNGNGNLHVRLPGDHSAHLPVAVNNAAAGATVLISP